MLTAYARPVVFPPRGADVVFGALPDVEPVGPTPGRAYVGPNGPRTSHGDGHNLQWPAQVALRSTAESSIVGCGGVAGILRALPILLAGVAG